VDSELSRFWIVNRHAIPVPPGNFLSYVGVKAITSVLKGVDWFEERDLRKAANAEATGGVDA